MCVRVHVLVLVRLCLYVLWRRKINWQGVLVWKTWLGLAATSFLAISLLAGWLLKVCNGLVTAS